MHVNILLCVWLQETANVAKFQPQNHCWRFGLITDYSETISCLFKFLFALFCRK